MTDGFHVGWLLIGIVVVPIVAYRVVPPRLRPRGAVVPVLGFAGAQVALVLGDRSGLTDWLDDFIDRGRANVHDAGIWFVALAGVLAVLWLAGGRRP